MKNKLFIKYTKTFLIVLLTFSFIFPLFTYAQNSATEKSSIIPECGVNQECGYYDLMKLVNNIINWIIKISIPVSTGVLAWAGFIYLTTAISDQKSYAKDMIRKVLIGFAIILSAWIVVTTITNTLLKEEFKEAVPVQGVDKN